ncbi:galactose oxidase [Pluteus cervinus]|uniref:Galactose oxidase n=1 Tax=Pluteus cervinus TaxID=181527 RepID=A0ACD3AYB2_9AGAR|nr:galactose oxidase [Pluteus cervinus]
MHNLLHLSLFITTTFHTVQAYTPLPRWGQATTLITNSLIIYGGKTDQFNSYSYTSAPNTDELLHLPLTSTFDLSSPPWELVGNSTPWQGLSWHSLTPYNTSQLLLFGGLPDANSPVVSVDNPDSAAVLDVSDLSNPVWSTKASSWASEPTRRIRHSACVSSSGSVYLIGGEKADDSQSGYSDHQVFTSSPPSFASLPTAGAPTEIYGHASVLLSDGRLLVMGGYSSSSDSLLPFSTIWSLDTSTSSVSWSQIAISGSSIPAPRRGFAATALSDGRVLIQGGSDADLLRNFDDGWVLDLSQSQWTQLPSLSQVGARRDHFAIPVGSQVLFGFGYANDAPASASLMLFDPSTNTFLTSFTPPTPTQTLPGPSQTGPSNHNGSSPPGSNNDGNDPSHLPDPNKSPSPAVAIGVALAVLALAVGGVVTYYVLKRRRSTEDRRFVSLRNIPDNFGDGEGSMHMAGEIPAAGHFGEKHPQATLLNSLGMSHLFSTTFGGRNVRVQPERRDMLADEDTREFGQWYGARRDASHSTTWSLKNILGGKVPSRLPSREPSISSNQGSFTWREKVDPFADSAVLLTDEEAGYIGTVSNQAHHRKYSSYASNRSRWSYNDPFVDPIDEQIQAVARLVEDTRDPSAHTPPPTLHVMTVSNSHAPHVLSPLVEQASSSSLGNQDAQGSQASHSQDHISPFESSSHATSHTSHDHLSPISPLAPRTTSLLGGSPPPSHFVQRSNSWWSRFTPSGFLDRKGSDASRRSVKALDIRDPNPPPLMLGAIDETISLENAAERPNHYPKSFSRRPYGIQNESTTSLKTSRTTDSEALEHMGGTMQVVQRVSSRHRHRTASTGTLSIETYAETNRGHSPEKSGESELISFSSPVEAKSPEDTVRPPPSAHVAGLKTAPRSPGGAVAARIQAYERRLTIDQEVLSPTNTRRLEERNVQYGLAPRPSLFVANPDRLSRDSS